MWKIILSLLFLQGLILADEKPETAWSTESAQMLSGPYVFGSIYLPPEAIEHLAKDQADDNGPFGGGENDAHPADVDKIAPIIPRNTLPACLPVLSDYRDLKALITNYGVSLKDKEWAVASAGANQDQRIYFCTTLQNADLIEQIFQFIGQGASTFTQIATLVSIDNQGLNNTVWTFDKLNHVPVKIHSRFGVHGYSGEKIWTSFTPFHEKTKDSVDSHSYAVEPTLGESARLLDCRCDYSCKIPNTNSIIQQNTALTLVKGTPFILDCGNHGNDKRNYLLVLDSSAYTPTEFGPIKPFVNVKKIEGIYAFQNPDQPSPVKANPKPAFTTQSYAADKRYLTQLRYALNSTDTAPDDDPFGDASEKPEHPAPIRVNGLQTNKHHQASDAVFNITPQLKTLNIKTQPGEWVYFNRSKNHYIVHGSRTLHTQANSLNEKLCPPITIVKIQGRIVSVDRSGLQLKNWTLDDIKKANPIYLARYATMTRSGDKASQGEIFTVEPVTGYENDLISLRYSIKTPPLGTDKIIIQQNSATLIKDGKPHIIELGHPNKSDRTLLLILNVDITLPDGRFYRNRHKPLP